MARADRIALVLCTLLASVGCSRPKQQPAGVALATQVPGLSGLTIDGSGVLWSVGEDAQAIIRIDPKTFAVTEFPIVGCPPKTELEAIAWVRGSRFAFGTETSRSGRGADDLLYGRVEGNRFVIGSSSASCNYDRWELSAPDNRGVEGLCHAGGVFLVAAELTATDDGRRWAPLGLYDPQSDEWVAHRLRLTSDTGKLAALSCKVEGDNLVALAVERHFGVSRLIRFVVPRRSVGEWIDAAVALDLAPRFSPPPNFEGIVWQDDGSVVLLNDNQYRAAATDASSLYFVPAAALR